jgi:hypothetical protein
MYMYLGLKIVDIETVSNASEFLSHFGPVEWVPPEDGDGPASEALCVLNKNGTTDDVLKQYFS